MATACLDVSRRSRAERIDPASLAQGVQLGRQEHPALRVPCDDPPLNVLGLIIDTELTQDCLHYERDPRSPVAKTVYRSFLLNLADHVSTSS
jgi:hypothetical protein